jgi:hypothetical protein
LIFVNIQTTKYNVFLIIITLNNTLLTTLQTSAVFTRWLPLQMIRCTTF